MSAVGPLFVTPHAVRRYRERWARGLSYEQALGELIRLTQEARPVKQLESGAWLWQGPRPLRLRFVVEEPDPGQLPALVTVLPGHRLVDNEKRPRPRTPGRR
ncbi:MAG: hypothetical protein AB7S38_29120 [Vulcanimicrobiota bacterium]